MSRRGESIYKRKDGRWEARYVKGVDGNGRKKYGSVYAKSYTEVKEKQLMKAMECKSNKTKRSIKTIDDLTNEWLKNNKNQLKKSSYMKYSCLIKNHISPYLGHIQVRYLSRQHIIDFTNQQLLHGKVNGGELSRKTVNDILIILKMILNYASEEYDINIPKISLLKEKKKEAVALSNQQQKKLVNYLIQDMDIFKFGVLLSLYSGMRIGELCALQWENVEENHIYVCKTLQRLTTENRRTEMVLNDPKSESSIRIIPILSQLKPYIEKYRQPSGFVLQTKNIPCIEPRLMQLHFKKMVDELHLPDVTFHTLRHTFATRCIEAGFDAKTLSEILGHSDVKITLNRYVHSSYQLKQMNMEKLSSQTLYL